jgi:hypothetical protein
MSGWENGRQKGQERSNAGSRARCLTPGGGSLAPEISPIHRKSHHVAQVLAPDCAPLFLTDGFREYLTALLTHYGQWV